MIEVVLAGRAHQALHLLEGNGVGTAHPLCHMAAELLEGGGLRKGHESFLYDVVNQDVALLVQLGEDIAADNLLNRRIDVSLLEALQQLLL